MLVLILSNHENLRPGFTQHPVAQTSTTMKITGYKLYQVPPRWLFLKIETDAGIDGWGEPVIEGKAHTVKAAVEELMATLVGKDPLNIEDHWNAMYRGGFYRGGPVLMSALSGLDQALWDLKGKALGRPRSEERRVGKECTPCRSRWSPYH